MRQGDRPATRHLRSDPPAWTVLVGLGCLLFTVGAVVLEVLSSRYANSTVPAWAHIVPLAWPAPLRVIWWLTVAAAAATFRWSLEQLGLRPNPVVTVVTVLPFVVFAAGIGAEAEWATWH